jgi:hypothetical protein
VKLLVDMMLSTNIAEGALERAARPGSTITAARARRYAGWPARESTRGSGAAAQGATAVSARVHDHNQHLRGDLNYGKVGRVTNVLRPRPCRSKAGLHTGTRLRQHQH